MILRSPTAPRVPCSDLCERFVVHVLTLGSLSYELGQQYQSTYDPTNQADENGIVRSVVSVTLLSRCSQPTCSWVINEVYSLK
jgi:hypothetical protein